MAAEGSKNEASVPPEWRSPSAYTLTSRNPIPRWPQKYIVGNVVSVRKDEIGFVEAKVISVQPYGDTWGYYLQDKNGKYLWSERIKLFKQDELDDDGDV